MYKKPTFLLFTFLLMAHTVFADLSQDPSSNTIDNSNSIKEAPVEEVSKAFGHYLAKKLLNQELSLLNADAVVQGLKEELEGKKAPLGRADYEKALETLQEKAYVKLAERNLKEAEAFLASTKKLPKIRSLESGQVQYIQTKKGSGKALKAHESALVRCQAKKLDGTPLNIAQNNEPVLLHLNEVISGMRIGMLGMLEGEARTLYIHPEKAYGEESTNPNALLVVDIELISTNVPYQEMSELPVNNVQIAHE